MLALDVLVRFVVISDSTSEIRLYFAEEENFVEDWEPDFHEFVDFGLAFTIGDPSSQDMNGGRWELGGHASIGILLQKVAKLLWVVTAGFWVG